MAARVAPLSLVKVLAEQAETLAKPERKASYSAAAAAGVVVSPSHQRAVQARPVTCVSNGTKPPQKCDSVPSTFRR